ncbi:MAG: hypothetical protein ABIB43_06865 [archaeon]
MVCEFRLKNYCFHPDRANGELIAINCVYDWLAKHTEEMNSKRQLENSVVAKRIEEINSKMQPENSVVE